MTWYDPLSTTHDFIQTRQFVKTLIADKHIVRLNAELHAVTEYEEAAYRHYGIDPLRVEALTPEELLPIVRDAEAIFAVSVLLPRVVIEAMENCLVISRMGAGTDKIDVARATELGIMVTNVPYFCIEEQADHAMAMLLGLERQLPAMTTLMRQGAWSEAHRRMRSSRRTVGRTLGLVGFGGSAKCMARRARGFGMRVLAYRRNLDAARREALEYGVEIVDMNTLLVESDYLSLHLPLSKENHHLFNAETFARMKPGSIFINTSRGGLVDERALVAALESGHLRGAGIDTWESIDIFSGVEKPPSSPLLEMENVIFSPHVAAGSVEAMQDVGWGSVANMAAVLSGIMPPSGNIVNPDVTPRIPLRAHDPEALEAVSTLSE